MNGDFTGGWVRLETDNLEKAKSFFNKSANRILEDGYKEVNPVAMGLDCHPNHQNNVLIVEAWLSPQDQELRHNRSGNKQ